MATVRGWLPPLLLVTVLQAAAFAVAAGACAGDPGPAATTSAGAAGSGTGGGAGGGGTGGSRLPNGAPCGAASDCQSNNCADGVCCNGACTEICEACDVAGGEGTCQAHAPATDPEQICAGGVCDGAGECAIGTHRWSGGYGNAPDQQLARRVAVDGNGNVVVVGSFAGSIDFGGSALVSAGGQDVFVAKLAPDGTELWSKRFGDEGDQVAEGVGIDVAGGIVVAGSFAGSVDFGGGALVSAGATDVFLVRLDADGEHVFSHRFGDAEPQSAHALVVTACGDLVVSGSFAGSIDFGGAGDELVSDGGPDVFLARLKPDGTHRHSRRIGAEGGTVRDRALASDTDGNVVLAGDFTGAVDLGGGALTAVGAEDVLVAKLDPDGAHLWSKRYGDEGAQRAGAVAVDSQGDIVLAGPFDGAIGFGGGADTLVSEGSVDLFVAKLDPDGGHRWSRRLGDGADQGGAELGLAVDWRRSIVLSGGFAGSLALGGDTLTSAGLDDVLVAKLAADGTSLWSKRFGDAGEQHGVTVAVSPDRSIVVAGGYVGSLDLGGGALAPQSAAGVFLAAFTP